MIILDPVYIEGNTTVMCNIDGLEGGIPVNLGNRHYVELMRQVAEEGLVIAPYEEPVE